MAINSIEYIIFVGIVCVCYYAVPKPKRWISLLIASYLFYLISSTKLIIFLIITTLSIYLVGIKLGKIDEKTKIQCENCNKEEKKKIKKCNKKKKKLFIIVTLILNFGILVVLKYMNFIGGNINTIFNLFKIPLNIPTVSWILPLGISYYTLQATSYIIDVYRGKYKPEKHFGYLALFVSFFPQIVEGPIGRYDKLLCQFKNPPDFKIDNLKNGIQLMLWGYFKKMVIADRAALYVDTVFNNYASNYGIVIILAIILYTIQIYAEFSGCIDIVRGVSQILGINLDKNFERPFFSKTIQEFWRRWHITLGVWLKEYIFYPVSLSKLGTKISNFAIKHIKNYIGKIIPIAFSLFWVWFINGIWHGASWKYIIYGLYYYVIMIIGRLFEPISTIIINKFKINVESVKYKLFQIIRTTILVIIGMLIFRVPNLGIALNMLKSSFNLSNINMLWNGTIMNMGWQLGDIIVLIISMVIFTIVSVLQEKGHSIREDISNRNVVIRWGLYYAIFFAILIFGIYGQGYNPSSFIYGQF